MVGIHGVPAVLSVIQKFFPTTHHITERLPHQLAVMFLFTVQKRHRLFMNGSQYAVHIILLRRVHETVQHYHHPEFPVTGHSAYLLHQRQQAGQVGGQNLAHTVGHQHPPFVFLPILVGQHQAVFLQLVEGLAHLASEVGIGTCIDEVLSQLQLVLAQGAEDDQGLVEHLFRQSAGGLGLLYIRTDIQVQFLADGQHFGFCHNHQDFRQRHGGGEGGVGESDHK